MQPRNSHIDAVAVAVIAFVLMVFQHIPRPRFMAPPMAGVIRFEQKAAEARSRMVTRIQSHAQSRAECIASRIDRLFQR